MPETNLHDLGPLIRDEANKIIIQHLGLCPFARTRIEERVSELERRWAALIGFMLGSGLLGGAGGALLTKLLGP